jgi:GNAT superfamily N-acetyltransferase
MINIKQAITVSDAFTVKDLAVMHHAEFGQFRSFAPDAVIESVKKIILGDEMRLVSNVWIAFEEATPVGYMFATAARLAHSWSKVATQQMFFVVPEYRKGSASKELILTFEAWAKNLGCVEMYLQVEHTNDIHLAQLIARIYKRNGYKHRGYIHSKLIGDRHDSSIHH